MRSTSLGVNLPSPAWHLLRGTRGDRKGKHGAGLRGHRSPLAKGEGFGDITRESLYRWGEAGSPFMVPSSHSSIAHGANALHPQHTYLHITHRIAQQTHDNFYLNVRPPSSGNGGPSCTTHHPIIPIIPPLLLLMRGFGGMARLLLPCAAALGSSTPRVRATKTLDLS